MPMANGNSSWEKSYQDYPTDVVVPYSQTTPILFSFIYCSKLLFNFTAGYLQVYDVFCPILLNYIELLDVIFRKKNVPLETLIWVISGN